MPQSLIPPVGGPHAPSAPRGGSYETMTTNPVITYGSNVVSTTPDEGTQKHGTASTAAVWGTLALCAAAIVFTVVALRGMF